MKLTKFALEKMSVAEMNAIKAGSGTCSSGTAINCSCSTGDSDNGTTDSDTGS